MKRVLRRLALVLGGTATGLLLAEAGARLLAPTPGEELLFNAPGAAPNIYLFDRDLTVVPEPGFRGRAAAPGYDVEIRINSVGLRGDEPGPPPRWLVVGDSFTMAAQVREEDTFVERLGRAVGVTMLNAGVDGYSTWQALGRYRSLDEGLGVKGVILVFFLGNDLAENTRGKPPSANAAMHGKKPPAPGAPMSTLGRLLYENSVLHAYLRVAQERRRLGPGTGHGNRFRDELQVFSASGRAQLESLMPATERALREFRDQARARGDRLLVAVAPPAFAMDEASARGTLEAFGADAESLAVDAPRDAVVGLLARLQVQTCDLTAALRDAARDGATPYLRFDGHWTPAGHAVVADTLAGCVGEPNAGAVNGR